MFSLSFFSFFYCYSLTALAFLAFLAVSCLICFQSFECLWLIFAFPSVGVDFLLAMLLWSVACYQNRRKSDTNRCDYAYHSTRVCASSCLAGAVPTCHLYVLDTLVYKIDTIALSSEHLNVCEVNSNAQRHFFPPESRNSKSECQH